MKRTLWFRAMVLLGLICFGNAAVTYIPTSSAHRYPRMTTIILGGLTLKPSRPPVWNTVASVSLGPIGYLMTGVTDSTTARCATPRR
jgi:hypothetical protein